MITVNSVSGGGTSSYITAHYPADIDIFALVCIDNHNLGRKIDPKIKQMANDRLQKFCPQFPEFIATAEDVKTLKVVLDLEQHIGREIVWVRGISYDSLIQKKQMIPSKKFRDCTTKLKIEPIFWYLYLNYKLPVKMRIGYRADEAYRADTFKDTFHFPIYSQLHNKPVNGGRGRTEWFQRWMEIPFRIGEFPLIENQGSLDGARLLEVL